MTQWKKCRNSELPEYHSVSKSSVPSVLAVQSLICFSSSSLLLSASNLFEVGDLQLQPTLEASSWTKHTVIHVPSTFYFLFLWPSLCHRLRKWLIDGIGTRQNKDATSHPLSDLQWSNWLTAFDLLFSRWFVGTFSWLRQVLTVEVSWGRDKVMW